MLDEDLKKLFRLFAAWSGCTIEEVDRELWKVKLSPDLARRARKSHWVLAFHRDLLEADRDAQLVTPGAPILQEVKEILRREPAVAHAWLDPAVPVPADVPAGITGVGVALRLHDTEVLYRSVARVHFRLVFNGAERHEEFFPVFLDAQACRATEEARQMGNSTPPVVDRPRVAGRVVPVDEARFLDAAFTEAESRVNAIVARLQQENARAAEEERLRAITWFEAMERCEGDVDLRASLPELRDSRLEEIQRRYQLDVELEPLSVIFYRLPRARVRLDPAGMTRHRFTVEVDLLSGRVVPDVCRRHGVPLERVTLCRQHGVGCEQCRWQCATCGRECCPDCARLSCPFCPATHCQACGVPCDACGRAVARDHVTPCAKGCGSVCPDCVRLLGSVPHCVRCCIGADCGHSELRGEEKTCGVGGHTYCRACASQSARCMTCRNVVCGVHHVRCAGGNETVCASCALGPLPSGRYACPTHAAPCSCGALALHTDIRRCSASHAGPTPGSTFCPSCRWTCSTCGVERCGGCPRTPCRLCGQDHCDDCMAPCACCGLRVPTAHAREHTCACGRLVCDAHSRSCVGGQERLCDACALLLPEPCCRSHAVRCACGHLEIPSEARACVAGCGIPCRRCRILTRSGDIGCTRCTTQCACGHVEIQTRVGRCAVGMETFCRECTPGALLLCPTCGRGACRSGSHTRWCASDNREHCVKCTPECHVCGRGRRVCITHGGACSDCGRHSCLAHRRRCTSCGDSVCPSCVSPSLQCHLCSKLAPSYLGGLEPFAAALHARGVSVKDARNLQIGQSRGRVVGQFDVGLTRYTFSADRNGTVHSCLERGALARLFGRKGTRK